MISINYQKFSFTIEPSESIFLPVYKGSTFRGGFGNTFRKILCALKRKECDDCILKTSCIYAYVFETLPLSDTEPMSMGKYERVPHPFVIEPPSETTREYSHGEQMTFGLCLIGRAVELLPYFILTFEELGNIGLGKGRGKYRLMSVSAHNNGVIQVVYSGSDKTVRRVAHESIELPENIEEARVLSRGAPEMKNMTLHFKTPARVLYQRRLVENLEFHVLVRHLLRRLQLLYYFHCGRQPVDWDHKRFILEAEDVTIADSCLEWHDWERYSTRQKRRMKMGGLVGSITYEGNISPFMPLLRAGEIFHVGKGTSFGLGKYVIETDERSRPCDANQA